MLDVETRSNPTQCRNRRRTIVDSSAVTAAIASAACFKVQFGAFDLLGMARQCANCWHLSISKSPRRPVSKESGYPSPPASRSSYLAGTSRHRRPSSVAPPFAGGQLRGIGSANLEAVLADQRG